MHFIVLVAAAVLVQQSAAESVKLDEYYLMPQIYDYDDYDRCVAGAEDAVYCVARSVIKPDQDSSLWRLIEHITNDTRRNFRHDHLDRGFCVDRCRQLVDSLDRETAEDLFVTKFDISFPYIIRSDAFNNVTGDRERYGRLINICQNYALRQYNLSAYTEIEYCTGPQRTTPIDGLDISFLVISALIVGLVIASTWYDHHTSKQLGNEHYKKDLPCRKTMVLTSFSLVRNWYRLVSRSKDQLNEDLKFFQAIRFFTFCLVVVGHCGDLFTATSFANTYGRESEYSNPLAHILINGSLIVQSFFEMSGFLLSIHFCTNQAKMKKISWAAIFVTVAYRYIRLTPAYAFILLLHATWLPKLQDGPFWPRGAEVERNLCRRNWWTNLLYVNNYVNADEPCLQQAWYLACDYQLFTVGLIILVTVTKYKKYVVHIFSVSGLIAILIPALVVYFNHFDGVFLVTLQAERFIYWFDEMYHKIYIPFHTNIGCYLGGVVYGYLYYRVRTSDNKGNRSGFLKFLWYMTVPCAMLTLMLSMIFYTNNFEKPSVWIAIFFPLHKNAWALFGAIVLYGIIYNYNRFVKSVVNFPLFVPLGRLTYCAYISHVFFLKNFFYGSREIGYFSQVSMYTKVISVIIASYILGAIVALTLEFPISALQKHLLSKQLEKISKPEPPKENNNVSPPSA
ncbi:nose resistant to fluoxetine protein 6-like [Anopheles ziemanni]|uniref:nose resistant to fluoxetine protein 6-like n=1 Tax=Anopheles coustani TaxID=139045 RepID=UPI002658ED36|nr:nose resistant to fluoxetine protein 6-like [Anopheles coustani]XP_058178689.1 nose resistant to fluoxetine protein 6-like [Anopheles ziemanni]